MTGSSPQTCRGATRDSQSAQPRYRADAFCRYKRKRLVHKWDTFARMRRSTLRGRENVDVASIYEIAESVINSRKSGAGMTRTYLNF